MAADLAVYPLGDDTYAVQENNTGKFLKDTKGAMLVLATRAEAEQKIVDFNNPKSSNKSTAKASTSTKAASGASGNMISGA